MDIFDRVARAIYEKRNGPGCRPWARQPAAYKAPYLDDARAALEVIYAISESRSKALDELGEMDGDLLAREMGI